MIDFVLEGNDECVINTWAALLLGLLPAAALLGIGIDRVMELCWPQHGSFKASQGFDVEVGRFSSWSWTLLAASYALLIPGLCSVLFSFNVMLDFGLLKMGIGPHGGLDKVPPTTESMLGLIHLLRTTDCEVGAAAVMLYAMVVPAVKVLLLLTAQVLRGKSPLAVQSCISIVQAISKWACPDMFAYILLTYLVRGLNHPTMLQAAMRLDLGFTCFTIFCIGSTVASLGTASTSSQVGNKYGSLSSLLARIPRNILSDKLAVWTVLFFAAFVTFFSVGLTTPVMALRINMDPLFAEGGPLPSHILGIPVEPVVENLKIPEKANADVSLLQATTELLSWTQEGEVNSFIAYVMLTCFVIALTSLDMLVLVAAAVYYNLSVFGGSMEGSRATATLPATITAAETAATSAVVTTAHYCQIESTVSTPTPSTAYGRRDDRDRELASSSSSSAVVHQCEGLTVLLNLSSMLRKIAMLDVLIMGIVVVTLCMSMYHKVGIYVSMREGLLALTAAEAFHYATYYMVQAICSPKQDCRRPSNCVAMSEFDLQSQDSTTPMLAPM